MSYLFLAIGLITFSIFIHELGHFLAARWRKMVVPRFSIFGIGPSIFSWKWRGVEYCICWLPIGAYVMVPQLSDLGSFEGEVPPEAANLPPADYLSKVIVAVAGPAANVLLALALACAVWFVGVNVPAEFNRTEIGEIATEIRTTDGKTVPGPAAQAGLRLGDVIKAVDGKPVANFQEVVTAIILGSQVSPDGHRLTTLTYERDGQTHTATLYPQLVSTEGLRSIAIGPRSDLFIDRVASDSPAAHAGLLPGDRILAVEGKLLARRDELREHFQTKHDQPSTLTVRRDGKEITTSLQPRLQTIEGQTAYLIGVTWRLETVTVHPSPFAQIGESARQAYQIIASLLNRKSDIGVRHMSGIVGIVDNLQQVASVGFIPALAFLISINVSLAIFNLLPIPVLDGGHVIFATLARLRGKPLNPVWMQNTVAACFILLIGLILYVSYNDVRRLIQTHADERPAATAPAAAPAKP